MMGGVQKNLNTRRTLVLIVLVGGLVILQLRALELQLVKGAFLRDEGVTRQQRVMTMAAHRGMILDRNGSPLAISTPVDSVWVNPKEVLKATGRIPELAQLLDLDAVELVMRLKERAEREFVYLKRHIAPELAHQVMALNVAGVNLQREYRRYYPMGEISAPALGFTDIDDRGQEGLELTYEDWLAGKPGAKRVLRDRLGRVVEDLEQVRAPLPGNDLKLTLDRRIQYLAYRELKATMAENSAQSGSVVVLDPRNGEILALASVPSYNPNNRSHRRSSLGRNRAVVDVLEPGSTIKPFTVAAALETGRYGPESKIQTAPGRYRVYGQLIRDEHNYGQVTLATLLSKSSNVGVAKVALSLPPEQVWRVYDAVGFGEGVGLNFPGEAEGHLANFRHWRGFEHATLAFGYGLAATPLQLARAYAVLANDGRKPVLSLIAGQGAAGELAMPEAIAKQVRRMLEGVTQPGGTGTRAAVPGYRVAGKTGTVHKTAERGYAEDRYYSVFVGMAPASYPRLVITVIIDEPKQGAYFGGLVAAPVFSRIMQGALRLLDVPPDALPSLQAIHPAGEEAA